MKINLTLIVLLLCLYETIAQPNFTHTYTYYGMHFFDDVQNKKVCYYLPGKLRIGKDRNGRPDVNFIMMRYAGSSVYNEGEGMRHRSIFSIRLIMEQPNADSMRWAKTELIKIKPGISIRPLPVSSIDAMVVFTPVGSDTVAVNRGALTAETDDGYNTSGTYWQERYFTLHLDNHSAMLLDHALRNSQTAISFMYAFYSKGTSQHSALDVSGHGKLRQDLQALIDLKQELSAAVISTKECVVRSDAFELTVDTTLYPDMIRQIDINDGVPPGYAVLNVRNYDFANKLRTDLYEKTVELEATGAGGKKVNSSVTFHAHSPEISSTNFRFKYAVKLNQPYRYRIRELYNDGREQVTDWTEVTMWSGLLDITSRPNQN